MRLHTLHFTLVLAGAVGCSSEDDGSGAGTGGSVAGTGGAAAGMGGAAAGTGGAPAGTGGGAAPAEYSYSACAVEDHVGGFYAGLLRPLLVTGLAEPYTNIGGRVDDGIVPELVPDVVMTSGDCSLVMGRDLFCDPECPVDQTCDVDGQCIPQPLAQDMGTVDITGLVDGPVSMMARAPRNNYAATGTFSYPGFTEGAAIMLTSTGGSGAPLSLLAEGVAPLVIHEPEVALVDGMPATATWDPPAQSGRSRVLASVNISLHGGDPLRIECDTDDDGSLEVPADLVSALLAIDYSGFPAISFTRQTAQAVQGPNGCIDFRVFSDVDRHPVTIDGLTSCNDLNPCPDGQTCSLIMACE